MGMALIKAGLVMAILGLVILMAGTATYLLLTWLGAEDET